MDSPVLDVFTEAPDSPRAFRRFPVNFTINVSLTDDKPSVRGATLRTRTKATLTNASMNGLCFSSFTEFPKDTLIEIEMIVGNQTNHVPAVVRRCSATKLMGRTFFECGVQYLKSDATLRFLPVMAKYLLKRISAKNSSDLKI